MLPTRRLRLPDVRLLSAFGVRHSSQALIRRAALEQRSEQAALRAGRELGLAESDAFAPSAVSGALSPQHFPYTGCSRIRVPWAEDAVCFTVDDLLSEEECARLIELSESYGYEQALVNIGGGEQTAMPEYRNSSRWMVDSEDAAALLWSRLTLIPEAVQTKMRAAALGATTLTEWRPVGLNPVRGRRSKSGPAYPLHCSRPFRSSIRAAPPLPTVHAGRLLCPAQRWRSHMHGDTAAVVHGTTASSDTHPSQSSLPCTLRH
jgi:hypothetical protein